MSKMPGNWGDLRARVIYGAGMATLALLCLAAGGWVWWFIVFMAGVGVAVEWGKLTSGESDGPATLVLGATTALAAVSTMLDYPGQALGIAVLGTLLLLGWTRKALLGLGALCIGGAVIALIWLRGAPVVGLANVLFVVAVAVCSDTGAYIAGRALGGPKLAPGISPGKTISGALGGLVSASLAGMAVAAWFNPAGQAGSAPHAALLGGLLGIVAQTGDLGGSWLKRRAGVKDSSQLIPGHGGLLDRLNALMLVAQATVILALALGRGVVLWQ